MSKKHNWIVSLSSGKTITVRAASKRMATAKAAVAVGKTNGLSVKTIKKQMATKNDGRTQGRDRYWSYGQWN